MITGLILTAIPATYRQAHGSLISLVALLALQHRDNIIETHTGKLVPRKSGLDFDSYRIPLASIQAALSLAAGVSWRAHGSRGPWRTI